LLKINTFRFAHGTAREIKMSISKIIRTTMKIAKAIDRADKQAQRERYRINQEAQKERKRQLIDSEKEHLKSLKEKAKYLRDQESSQKVAQKL